MYNEIDQIYIFLFLLFVLKNRRPCSYIGKQIRSAKRTSLEKGESIEKINKQPDRVVIDTDEVNNGRNMSFSHAH